MADEISYEDFKYDLKKFKFTPRQQFLLKLITAFELILLLLNIMLYERLFAKMEIHKIIVISLKPTEFPKKWFAL